MKRKYQGIVSVILIVLAVAAGVLYAVRASQQRADEIRISSIKPFPSISVPDPVTINKIEAMKERMVELVQLTTSRVQPVNLGFLGYEPTDVTEEVIEEREKFSPASMGYSLSLTFSSGTRRFCVIDGNFYAEGATLPDGATIVKVESNRVLINRDDGKEWIDLRQRKEGARQG